MQCEAMAQKMKANFFCLYKKPDIFTASIQIMYWFWLDPSFNKCNLDCILRHKTFVMAMANDEQHIAGSKYNC